MSQQNNLSPNGEIQTSPTLPGLDLRAILHILRKWTWLLLIGALLGAGLGYWVSLQTDPIYRAEALIVIEQSRSLSAINAPELLTNDRTSTYLEFINQGLMDDKVAAQLGISLNELKTGISNIRVSQIGRTELFKIVVEGYFPDYVAAVANAIPIALDQSIVDVRMTRFEESKNNLSAQLSVLRMQIDTIEAGLERIGTPRTAQEESELRSQEQILAQYRNSYASLVQSYENVRLVEIQSLDNIAVARPAKTPTAPVSSNLVTNMILGFVIGVSTMLTMISLFEYLDDGVKNPEILQEVIDSTLLGVIDQIPKTSTTIENVDDKLIALHEPRHLLAEYYRVIRTNLRFASLDSNLTQLMLTSPTTSEGKSTTVANLAISLAQTGQKVLIIDADLRKPTQHSLFNLQRHAGLAELLFQPSEDFEQYIQNTAQTNLFLLSSGSAVPNPTDVLESKRLQQLLTLLRDEFDIIIFDTPPVLPVSDAAVLASFIPNVIMIANAKKTRQSSLLRAMETLQKVGVRPIGTILNQYRGSGRGYYGYDAYYSD